MMKDIKLWIPVLFFLSGVLLAGALSALAW